MSPRFTYIKSAEGSYNHTTAATSLDVMEFEDLDLGCSVLMISAYPLSTGLARGILTNELHIAEVRLIPIADAPGDGQ